MAHRVAQDDPGLAQNRWLQALNLPTVGGQVISFLDGSQPAQFARACRATHTIFQNKLLVDLTEMRGALPGQVQRGLTPEENNLARRVQHECARLHLNPSRLEDLHACFQAVFESQKRQATAYLIPAARLPFLAQLPRDFRREEGIFLQPEVQQRLDTMLRGLWRIIKGRIPEGPAEEASAAEIRAWMNTRESEVPLERIGGLNLQGFSLLPPEIGKLSRLQLLVCSDAPRACLTGLPDEMRNLRQLARIHFANNALREIPQLVDELPSLRELQIRNNQTPITVLPDHIWRRFRRENFADEFLKFIWGDARSPIDGIGLNIGLLTNIPFGFSLLRTCSLSYLPITYSIYEGLSRLIRPIGIPHEFNPLLDCLFVVLLFPPLAVIQTLLNLPAFLTNLLLLYVVEPIATAIRDEMGLDRNVQVH